MRLFRGSFGETPRFVLETNKHSDRKTSRNHSGHDDSAAAIEAALSRKSHRFSFSGRMGRWSSKGGIPYSLRRKSGERAKSHNESARPKMVRSTSESAKSNNQSAKPKQLSDAETEELVEETLKMLNSRQNNRDSCIKHRETVTAEEAAADMSDNEQGVSARMVATNKYIPAVRPLSPMDIPWYGERNTPSRVHVHEPLLVGGDMYEEQSCRERCFNHAQHMDELSYMYNESKVHSVPAVVKPHARVPSMGSGTNPDEDLHSEPYSEDSSRSSREEPKPFYDWREMRENVDSIDQSLDRWDMQQLERDIEGLLGVKI